ncbi:zinc carboxypeptidase [Burkholderia ubonensis]|nr:zinc carboxypeptidase [Burkholderia ubonensis]
MIPPLLETIGAVPDLPAIPTFRQMVRNTMATALRYPDLATVTRVGVSGQGEPIDMISIGDGPMSALFVGAPHPNEPVGCMVIEHLIDRLCRDHALRRALPYRWHFIKAIEPDALRLNEGWFSAPGDLLRYYEHYYRPPTEQQAEYTFPFAEDDRLARHPMPENQAWRKAIELAKPDFLYSLHNSEFGGAFYLLSDMPTGLATELKALCDTYGLPLNTVGDTALNELRWEPGLFRFPDMQDLAARTQAACQEPGVRPTGNSSAGYTSAMGTLSLFAEVPYWDCERLRDDTPSPHGSADVAAALETLNVEVVALTKRALALDCARSNQAASNMWRVVQTHCDHFSSLGNAMAADPVRDRKLTWAEHTIRHIGGRLERLSTVGLASRLAMMSLDRSDGFRLAADCRDVLLQQIDRLTQTEGLRPIPLKRLVQFQLHAGLATMVALSARRPRIG